jgi:hypothetical protein
LSGLVMELRLRRQALARLIGLLGIGIFRSPSSGAVMPAKQSELLGKLAAPDQPQARQSATGRTASG